MRLRISNERMTAIETIRRDLFGVSQARFAEIAGVNQATVSRWERGGSPSLSDIARIRAAAIAEGLEWSDEALFATAERAPAA